MVIPGLPIVPVSDVVELDDYWTLKGELDLAGFDGVECAQLHGELGNMAKLRLRVKEGVRQGSDISGTLKIMGHVKNHDMTFRSLPG